MTAKEKIDQLRAELHRHNYNYYVLNAPEISDKEFDDMMRELQDMEREHPEYQDETSPTMRVGSDLNKNFTQVTHKYPMLSLGNTYSEGEVSDFLSAIIKSDALTFRKALAQQHDGCHLRGLIQALYAHGCLMFRLFSPSPAIPHRQAFGHSTRNGVVVPIPGRHAGVYLFFDRNYFELLFY